MKRAATHGAFCYIFTFLCSGIVEAPRRSPGGRKQQASERNRARIIGTKNEPHADSTANSFSMGRSTRPLWCSWGNAFGVQFKIQAAGQRFESLR
jgi:hypothetical protein